MKGLITNKAEHIYKWEGLEVPSVSDVIEPYIKGLDFVKKKYLVKGKDVHELFEWYDLGKLKSYLIHPDYKPYFDVYKTFKKDNPLKINFKEWKIEEPYYNKILKFAGTPDRHDNKMIIDYKTGIFYKHYALQMHGYRLLLESIDGIKRAMYCVLINDKKYKIIKIPYKPRDIQRVKSALDLFRY